jgi:hypothetical protein
MMTKSHPTSFARLVQVLALAWLIQSPMFIQGRDTLLFRGRTTAGVDLKSVASQISACSPHQQIVIAIMLDLDVSIDLSVCGFSTAVINLLRSCPKSEWKNIALSLQLQAVVDIAMKFTAVSKVYSMVNIYATIDTTVANACASIFAQLSASNPTLSALLDIRANAQLSTIFSKYGCATIPALVNLCLVIQLSLFLNPAFINVCVALFSDLAGVLNSQVIPAITSCLINVNASLSLVLTVVLNLVSIGTSVLFACVADILSIVSPSCPCLINSSDLFLALYPSCASCPRYSVPYLALQPCSAIFQLISIC